MVTSTQYIGADKNVKLEYITCDALTASETLKKGALLQTRQEAPDVCGAMCKILFVTFPYPYA